MNGPKRTACLAKGYNNDKLGRKDGDGLEEDLRPLVSMTMNPSS